MCRWGGKHITLIKHLEGENGISSILEEFSKINKKPLREITELKDIDGTTITSQGILREIDKNIRTALSISPSGTPYKNPNFNNILGTKNINNNNSIRDQNSDFLKIPNRNDSNQRYCTI